MYHGQVKIFFQGGTVCNTSGINTCDRQHLLGEELFANDPDNIGLRPRPAHWSVIAFVVSASALALSSMVS